MYIGCIITAIGWWLFHFIYARYALVVATSLYLFGAGVAIESRFRLRSAISNGYYPFVDVQTLRRKSESFLWGAPGLMMLLALVIFWDIPGFKRLDLSQPLLWSFLLYTNTAGSLPAILRTPYNNPDSTVQYPKWNWTRANVSLTAFLLSAFAAWIIANDWVSANRPLHWVLIAYACSALVISSIAQSSEWPEPKDHPSKTSEEFHIEWNTSAQTQSNS